MTNPTISVRLTKGATILTAAAGVTVLGLSPAAAHVTANATSTAAGGYTQITFSVPTESDTAATNKLQLTLPEDTPFASVRTKPMEGWTAEVTEKKLPSPATVGEGAITEAASTITWTADEDHVIDPGEFQTFTISVGPLPEEEGQQILLPVAQTYTDGRTVAWDQPTPDTGEEPKHPSPSLTITAPETTGHGTTEEPATAAEQTAATSPSGGSALAWAGLIAGLLGLAAGLTALIRTRRSN